MKTRARKRTAALPADKGLTEQKVVAAALRQIDTVGLSNFSLRDVAPSTSIPPLSIGTSRVRTISWVESSPTPAVT